MVRFPKGLSVGQVAERSGLAVSAIHFYESKGLIHSWRTGANHRRYSAAVLRRLAVIQVAQRAGVPLRDIANALATLPDDSKVTRSDWETLSRHWAAELDDRIARLQRLRTNMGACIGCGCLSLDMCQLVNPDDEISKNGPGPRYLEEDAPELKPVQG